MADTHGSFVWYELMTDNADAAQDFYGKVIGWGFAGSDNPDMDYRHISAPDGEAIGGVMPLSDEMKANGARPCWMGYIAVDDVDASAKAIEAAGGSIHMEPWDIPNVGRLAFVADPAGAMFYIMRDADTDRNSTAFAATEPMLGHCAWNELATSDQSGALSFYTGQFAWKQEGDMDMGPMGTYQFFHHGPGMIGGVMAKPDQMPVSAWTYYFRVADIDAVMEAIKANGGKVLHEPSEIPGGEYQLNAQDPQGAYFAVVGPKK